MFFWWGGPGGGPEMYTNKIILFIITLTRPLLEIKFGMALVEIEISLKIN